jgi:hypothetical protein
MANTARAESGDPSPEAVTARRPRSTRFDPTSIDLTDVDLARALRQATAAGESLTGRAVDLAKDATYVTVGLSLLTFQRAQVRRRELERALRR